MHKNKNKNRFQKALSNGLVLLLLLLGSVLAVADDFEDVPGADTGAASVVEASVAGDAETEADTAGSEDEAVGEADLSPSEQEEFLQKLYDELNLSKQEYYHLTSQIKETRARISNAREELSELQTQLLHFDDQMADTTDKLLSAIRQLTKTENEIKLLYEEIEVKETALAYQKSLLEDYIRELYVYGDTYLEVDEAGDVDAFKLLLSDGDTSEVLKEIKYLGILEEAGARLVDRLDTLTGELKTSQDQLHAKKDALDKLRAQFNAQKNNLEEQKTAKENLLRITRAQDDIYRGLLRESLAEQREAFAEIKAFEDSIVFVEKKIAEEGDAFDIANYEDLVGKRFMSVYEFQKISSFVDEFVWPVDPDRGISAYFHDPSYRGFFGVQHNAIDIRAVQGTPVRAVADAVVYRVKDNGYGYSYITLVHHDGLMTNYGHMSEMGVEEGEIVQAGDVIGLSGGMPGTKGAGYMTTGPHLHIEFVQNGAYVDALRFLPLEYLGKESVLELPEKYRDDWERAILVPFS
ncbi:peptidoglycan DD-metalloendopeptidase family protein [Candidatus Peregrinibacteria bacterium]|jgi:murein DD-endopeptidase MepM/ murein hydrolase activator NlpD|nr:peptidoglycan DD-metalloendopeptidase family protein [Candidatus Peregrinibacteria bacterium]MBT4055742.1 peptidoglycan DD-metalloendopeptidase family protein [Candidatus Peregrinibacteria bacterium]